MNSANTGTQWLCAPILPVVVVDSVDQGLAIAEGLLAGGLGQIEVTLRTEAALPAMRAIAKMFPTLKLSAGTVLTPQQFDQATDAGASLFISPGLTETLADYARQKNYNWMPGVATASEVMRAVELGYHSLKFFPAMAAGGPKALAGITAPIGGLNIVPTGGVTLDNLKDWKALPAVRACGGTWLTANLPSVQAGYNATSQCVAERASIALDTWNKA